MDDLRLTLMDLPIDAIGEIARHAGDSLCNFALAHPRFAIACSNLRRDRMKLDHTCESLIRLMALNSQTVRALILVNCHSESSLILSLILKCPHLTELNTVNSGLTTPDLVQSINFLSRLETLTCSVPERAVDSNIASLPENHSIKSIYVEHRLKAFVFLLKLINSCLKIERLQMIYLPLLGLDSHKRWPTYYMMDNNLSLDHPITRERWQTLHTVILVSFQLFYEARQLRSLFQNCTASSDVLIKQMVREKEIVYDRGSFNLGATNPIVNDESSVLNRMYRVGPEDPVWHYGKPMQLRIEDCQAWSLSGSLPESIASLTTLVELDLSECHSKNEPHIWDPLFQSSTGLESLTVPRCLLTIGSCDKHQDEDFPFVKSLERLRLKKLCCLCCRTEYQYRFDYQRRNVECHESRLLPYLTGLTHLEELTLINPQVGRDFLSRIAIRSMVCLRIKSNSGYLNLPKLKSFFATCRKLRYLKLDFHYLPLHERLLWWRSAGIGLKQLCIKSSDSKAVDLRMVRRFLPKLCESLDVLHVHAHCLPNAEEFSSLLASEIAKINLTREHNPLRWIPANSQEYDTDLSLNMIPNFPGRALCCTQMKSRLELVGWNVR